MQYVGKTRRKIFNLNHTATQLEFQINSFFVALVIILCFQEILFAGNVNGILEAVEQEKHYMMWKQ